MMRRTKRAIKSRGFRYPKFSRLLAESRLKTPRPELLAIRDSKELYFCVGYSRYSDMILQRPVGQHFIFPEKIIIFSGVFCQANSRLAEMISYPHF